MLRRVGHCFMLAADFAFPPLSCVRFRPYLHILLVLVLFNECFLGDIKLVRVCTLPSLDMIQH